MAIASAGVPSACPPLRVLLAQPPIALHRLSHLVGVSHLALNHTFSRSALPVPAWQWGLNLVLFNLSPICHHLLVGKGPYHMCFRGSRRQQLLLGASVRPLPQGLAKHRQFAKPQLWLCPPLGTAPGWAGAPPVCLGTSQGWSQFQPAPTVQDPPPSVPAHPSTAPRAAHSGSSINEQVNGKAPAGQARTLWLCSGFLFPGAKLTAWSGTRLTYPARVTHGLNTVAQCLHASFLSCPLICGSWGWLGTC